jgi:hypothetical protein
MLLLNEPFEELQYVTSSFRTGRPYGKCYRASRIIPCDQMDGHSSSMNFTFEEHEYTNMPLTKTL